MPLVDVKGLDPSVLSPAEFRQYKVCCAAIWASYQEPDIHYGNGRSEWSKIAKPPPHIPTPLDCSLFVTWCFRAANVQDPNGGNYASSMNTLSLWASKRGTYIGGANVGLRMLHPGDLIFSTSDGGPLRGGNHDHVQIYIDDGLAISMGNEDGPHKLDWNKSGKQLFGVKRYTYGAIK